MGTTIHRTNTRNGGYVEDARTEISGCAAGAQQPPAYRLPPGADKINIGGK